MAGSSRTLPTVFLSRTQRRDEPLFRVERGQLEIQNVTMIHQCSGVDIWNGNAAIQIVPTPSLDDAPPSSKPAAPLANNDNGDDTAGEQNSETPIALNTERGKSYGIENKSTEVDDIPSTIASLRLYDVEVSSWSGRGIVAVNSDKCRLQITNSYIHDCAATGVYVAGTNTVCTMRNTDVVHNGVGSNGRRDQNRLRQQYL